MRNGSLSYRPEIDGLRALAVLLVILFHLDVEALRGGFIGVDVFFVISGYLITKIILKELAEKNSFSFSRFYLRRLRRLFPAFIFTISLTFVGGLIFLSPDLLQQLSASSVYSVLTLPNIYFWLESGYFETASQFKPLLHMWSLGVEEQFYFIWPATLTFLVLFSPRLAKYALFIIIFFGSLWAAQYMLARDPDAAFFLMPFRIYEFSMGAAVVALDRYKPATGVWAEGSMVLGLILIIGSALGFNDLTPFPGLYALIPCFGAALIIYAGPVAKSSLVLRNKAMLWIGLISYSLYLVHWPIIVFYKYYIFEELSLLEKSSILGISIFIAGFMRRYIELPFQHPLSFPSKKPGAFVCSCTGITALFLIIPVYTWSSDGLAWRMPSALSVAQIEQGKSMRFTPFEAGCKIVNLSDKNCNNDASLQVLVIGNSHELDAYNAFNAIYGENSDLNFTSFGTLNRCEYVVINSGVNVTKDTRNCRQRFNNLLNQNYIQNLDIIIYNSNNPFSENKNESWLLLDSLKNINPKIKIIALGGYIILNTDCPEIINRTSTVDGCRDKKYVKVFINDESQLPVYQKFSYLKFDYISKIDLLCFNGALDSCLVGSDGEPFTYDSHHLSLSFAQELGSRIKKKHSKLLQSLGFPDI